MVIKCKVYNIKSKIGFFLIKNKRRKETTVDVGSVFWTIRDGTA